MLLLRGNTLTVFEVLQIRSFPFLVCFRQAPVVQPVTIEYASQLIPVASRPSGESLTQSSVTSIAMLAPSVATRPSLGL
jgi:hypothetical protein